MNRQEKIDMKKLLKILLIILLLLILGVTLVWQGEIRTLATVKQVGDNPYLYTMTYQAKYEAGTVSASELLQQQERYLSALNDYVQNKYTYIISEKVLRIYLGKN